MNIYYFYLILLLLSFILIYYGLSFSFKFASIKIRVISLMAFMFISLRYIALLIFLIAKNIKNLYLLKPITFFNLLCIPVLALIAIYILARNDKLKFNYCIITSALMAVLYTVCIIKLPVHIEIFGYLGYIMSFYNTNLVYGIYVIINTIFFFTAVVLLKNKNINKLGMWIILASSFIVIIEILLRTTGIFILPSSLIGDFAWLLTADYSLYKLKK